MRGSLYFCGRATVMLGLCLVAVSLALTVATGGAAFADDPDPPLLKCDGTCDKNRSCEQARKPNCSNGDCQKHYTCSPNCACQPVNPKYSNYCECKL